MKKQLFAFVLLASSSSALDARTCIHRIADPFEAMLDWFEEFDAPMIPLVASPAYTHEARQIDPQEEEAEKKLDAIQPTVKKDGNGTVTISFSIEGINRDDLSVTSTDDKVSGTIPFKHVYSREIEGHNGTLAETTTYDATVAFAITPIHIQTVKQIERKSEITAVVPVQKASEEVATETVKSQTEETTSEKKQKEDDQQKVATSVSSSVSTNAYALPSHVDISSAHVVTKDNILTITFEPKKQKQLAITHL